MLSQPKSILNMGGAAVVGFVAALTFLASSATVHAEPRTFGCSFVSRYSPGEVSAALSYARFAVGPAEASGLYAYYLSLKSECRSNPAARRVVNLSPAVVAVIAGR